jgi:DNA-binding MarR family transcriptional regulator
MTAKISNLESHAGYWLRCVSNHVSRAFSMKVETHGVTVAEWVVMRALFDVDGMSPSRLADSIGHARGTVSKLMERLETKGFVQRHAEHADRRYQFASLTAQGRELVPVLAELADQNDREFFGDLGDRTNADLVAILKDICHRHGLKSVPMQ